MSVSAQSDAVCKSCGGCCDGTWTVEATLADQRREPRIPPAADKSFRLPDGNVVLARLGRACPFLDLNGAGRGCAIYRTRPGCCRRTMQGGRECNESRARNGLELIQIALVRD